MTTLWKKQALHSGRPPFLGDWEETRKITSEACGDAVGAQQVAIFPFLKKALVFGFRNLLWCRLMTVQFNVLDVFEPLVF